MSKILPINSAYDEDKLEIDEICFDDLNKVEEYIKKNNEIFDTYADILLKDIFDDSEDNNNEKKDNANNKSSVLKAV